MGALLLLIIFLVAVTLFTSKGKGNKRSAPKYSYPVAEQHRSFMHPPAPVLTPIMNDYNDYLLTSGLEKSVVDSHRQFVSDIAQTTTGASAQTVLSSDVYDNPFVGLRRPDLNVPVDPSARQVTSAEQWQYPTSTRYDRSGLF